MTRIPARLLITLLEVYQRTISRLLPPVCRFRPTCSQYTIQALQTYGLVRGLFLGLGRILRCHPFSSGGEDPLPLPNCSDNIIDQQRHKTDTI